MPYKIGIGYDIHRLVLERKLFIGGIEIPYIKGLLGHSDADVLIHALCDALLGAASLPDIGELFPDTDQKYCNENSSKLLKLVYEKVKDNGYKIENVDMVLIAEEPKIAPFKKQIKENLSKILGITESQINLKAKTNESLGDIGAGEAIASYVVVLLAN